MIYIPTPTQRSCDGCATCTYIHIYIYVYIHIHIHTYDIHIYTHTHTYIYAYMHIYIHTYMRAAKCHRVRDFSLSSAQFDLSRDAPDM